MANQSDINELNTLINQYTQSYYSIIDTMGNLIKVATKLVNGLDEEGFTLTQAAKNFIKAKYLPMYNSLPTGDFKTKLQQIWSEL